MATHPSGIRQSRCVQTLQPRQRHQPLNAMGASALGAVASAGHQCNLPLRRLQPAATTATRRGNLGLAA